MSNWKGFHIYYYDNQDLLISDCISPIITEMGESITSFFFIRYWLGGPHLRLRLNFRDSSEIKVNQVSSMIKKFLNEKPSLLELNVEDYLLKSKQMSEKQRDETHRTENSLVANNSLVFTEYQKEIKKYFDNKGVLLAEEQFRYSTDIVLKLFNSKINRNKKIFISLQYMYSILKCHESFLIESFPREFIYNYHLYWKDFSFTTKQQVLSWESKMSSENTSIIKKRVIEDNLFDSNFVTFHQDLFKRIEMRYGEESIYSFLFNFIHLFHNRLGITPLEEAFIALYASKLF